MNGTSASRPKYSAATTPTAMMTVSVAPALGRGRRGTPERALDFARAVDLADGHCHILFEGAGQSG